MESTKAHAGGLKTRDEAGIEVARPLLPPWSWSKERGLMLTYSHYETSILGEARALKTPYRTPLSLLLHIGTSLKSHDGEISRDHALNGRVLAAGLGALNRVVRRSLSSTATLAAFRKEGHFPMRTSQEIAQLDLWEVDEVASPLVAKYALLGGTLGLVTGVFGMHGALADVPMAMALGLRAVNDCAAHYGFDTSDPEDQRFATRILVSALSPKADPKDGDHAMSDAAEAVASFSGIVGVLGKVRRLGRRVLARRAVTARAARVLPLLGAVLAAGLNAWLLRGVAQTAEIAYRERFVARKHEVTDPDRRER